MKIKLSKSQWEEAGKKAGWIKKEAQNAVPINPSGNTNPYAGQAKSENPYKQNVQYGTPASAPSTQYSLSKSAQWADSTKDPNIMDFVNKVNSKVQTEGVAKWTDSLNLIMKAMTGDQSALQQLKQRSGGQAVPIK